MKKIPLVLLAALMLFSACGAPAAEQMATPAVKAVETPAPQATLQSTPEPQKEYPEISFKTVSYEEENEGYSYSAGYIQLEGVESKAAEEKINTFIRQNAFTEEESLKELLKEGIDYFDLFGEMTIAPVAQIESYFSLRQSFYGNMAGAHYTAYEVYYLFDLKTGGKIGVEALFIPGFDYKAYLTKACKVAPKADDRNYGANWPREVTDSVDFYLSQGRLYLVFDPEDYTIVENIVVSVPLTEIGTNFALWNVAENPGGLIKEVRLSGSTSRLNVRENPSANAPVLGKLQNGAKVEFLGEEGEWSKIKTAAGAIAYVASRYLFVNPFS